MPKEIPGIGTIYSVSDVMHYLEVSKDTVLRYHRSGKLPGRKFGRSVYFLDTVLKQFLGGRYTDQKKKNTPKKENQETRIEFTGETIARQLKESDKEKQEIIDAMKAAKNYRAPAAKILGISRATLNIRTKKYNLAFPSNRGKKRKI